MISTHAKRGVFRRSIRAHGARESRAAGWHQRGLPNNTTRNGYHLAFWRAGNLAYCAVSDTAWDELLGLSRLLQDLSTRDGR